MSWRVCSTPGCPNLIETPARKCDACTRAQRDRTRTRGRNPYNTKGHQSFRRQVLARDPYCTCPGDPEPGAGGKPQGGAAPAPINLHAQDMLDQIEDGLQDMWNETGVESRPRWQTLLRDSPRRLPDLCRASRSGHWLTWLIHTCERIEPLVDRRPRTRRIIGVCPECGREVMASKGESLLLCKCGNPINVQQLREQSRDKAESIHLTKTPAGMSQWLKDNYGYEVSRKQISNWLNRGKLPSSKPVDDGYWEFNIREILALAMGSSGRPA